MNLRSSRSRSVVLTVSILPVVMVVVVTVVENLRAVTLEMVQYLLREEQNG